MQRIFLCASVPYYENGSIVDIQRPFSVFGRDSPTCIKKKDHAVLCLWGEIGMLGPHHKDSKTQRKILWSTIPSKFS